ncbi:hypothetical protein D9613_011647 [Agrocybe pediades]|uniref:Uncharacterized protein n=1 Tax=Agrocybe pediades TaxID=84607 RepID=A0A8H4QWY8_9AGAR|nr:hypothetical protein D9613_011647 [Agrocybe pediades]
MSESMVLRPAVIVDDRDEYITYAGRHWKQAESASALKQTLTVLDSEDLSAAAANQQTALRNCLNVSAVQGASDVTLYGVLEGELEMRYSPGDNGTLSSALVVPPENAGASLAGHELLRLNASSRDSLHTGGLAVCPKKGKLNVDYLTYTPTSDTPINGRDIIVDDRYEGVRYAGSWEKRSARLVMGTGYDGTMTSTNRKGDAMRFEFFGSSVAVYGILNQVEGELVVDFAVDGRMGDRVVLFDGSQEVGNASRWTFNKPLWEVEEMAPGHHALYVELRSVSGSQVLNLDSIIYTSSVDSISQTLPGSTDPWARPPSSSFESTASSKAATMGTIVGVLLGLLFGCLFCAVLYRRCSSFPVQTPPPPAPSSLSALMANGNGDASANRYSGTRGMRSGLEMAEVDRYRHGLPEYDPEAGIANPPPPYRPKEEEEEEEEVGQVQGRR